MSRFNFKIPSKFNKSDYSYETVSKCIVKFTNKKDMSVVYRAFRFNKYSFFDNIKDAKKYIDFISIQNKQPQLYNTFKRVK